MNKTDIADCTTNSFADLELKRIECDFAPVDMVKCDRQGRFLRSFRSLFTENGRDVKMAKERTMKCRFQYDHWGLYITPLIGYSWNTVHGKSIWFGWLRWLWTFQFEEGIDDDQRTYVHT